MTPEQLEDEAARPRAPDYPGLAPAERAHGRQLALIHDMYRAELAGVRRLLGRIGAQEAAPAELVPALDALEMTRNMRLFGALCGRNCALLQNHHDIEEQWMFPAIAAHAEPALQAVIDRLIAEHEVIQDLIIALRKTATRLAQGDGQDGFADCAAAFARLERAILSHFGYEETQLEAPLAVYRIPI